MTDMKVNKRGVSPVIATVLLIVTGAVLASIVAYAVIPTVRNVDASCLEALKGISFEDVGFSCYIPESSIGPLSSFSVRITQPEIVGFQVGFEGQGSADTYEVRNDLKHDNLCLLDNAFGGPLEVPEGGDVRTYITKGNFEKVFISPILASGKKCFGTAHKEQDFDAACVNPESKARILSCGTSIGEYCGDGEINGQEQCDFPDLGGETCLTIEQGFNGGTLGCYPAENQNELENECTFDTSQCTSPPAGTDCVLTGARWSVSEANELDNVQLIVRGDNCNGQSLSLDIFEDDPPGSQDDFVTGGIIATFAGSQATKTWQTVWMNDGLFGLANPPEYYFTAEKTSAMSEEDSISSLGASNGLDLLEVHRASTLCGDGIIDEDEECDDGDLNNQNDCTNSCNNAVCGDNWVWNQGTGNEVCDGDTQTCVINGYNGLQTCNSPLSCTWGACVPSQWCGDGICNGPETTTSCAQDCPTNPPAPDCGNGIIEAGEECEPPGTSQACNIGTPIGGGGIGISGEATGQGTGTQICEQPLCHWGACVANP